MILLRSDGHGEDAHAKVLLSSQENVVVHQPCCPVIESTNLCFGWTGEFEETTAQADLQQVTGGGTAVHELVIGIDRDTLDDTLDLSRLTVKGLELLVDGIVFPDAHHLVTSGDEFLLGMVEVGHAGSQAGRVLGCVRTAHGRSLLNVPEDDGVVILAAQRYQVRVLGREG